MLDILNYSFMVRALIAGLIIALIVPIIGSFLVARRYSLIADSLAHFSLAGVGVGLLIGIDPILATLPITIAGAIIIEYLRQKRGISGESGLAIMMSAGLSIAIVLASLSSTPKSNFSSFLFGSITTTSWNDIVVLLIAAVISIVVILRNYKALLHIAFDEDSARIYGYKVDLINYLLATVTATIVVLSLRIVGGLLISALLTIPIITASRFSSSFQKTIIIAVGLAIASVIIGLFVAFYIGTAAGGSIVLTSLALFILSLIIKR